jgi:predicted Zn finger-like uncharacterized protein
MNIRCPHCQTVFRVNPERIPPQGVRARCARCGDSFMVTPPKADPAGAAQGSATAAPPRPAQPPAPPPPPRPAAASPAAAPYTPPAAAPYAPPPPAPQPPQHRPYTPPVPPPVNRPAPASPAPFGAQPAAQAQPSPAAATTARSPFGQRDPNARATRIARALVSDIVAYHPERRDQSLAAGTLRTEFREEIMKSWEEYVAQVGEPMAKSTPFFRDALNAILAKGQQIF